MCPVGDVPGASHSSSSSQSTRPQLSAPATQRHPPEHRHITYFVIDMHQAGIEVRPLPDIDGPGTLLNEVFLPDAGVAGVAVVGEVNDGWRATLTTLANERNLLGANTQGVGGKLERAWTRPHDTDQRAARPCRFRRRCALRQGARLPPAGPSSPTNARRTATPWCHKRWLVQRSRHRGDLVAADVGRRRHSASRVASTLKLLTSHNLHRPARAALDV